MGRNKKPLTQKQIEWRESILKGRVKSVKQISNNVKISSDDNKLKTCFYYIDNCVYWINAYIDGTTTADRLLETAKALRGQAINLELAVKELLINSAQP